MDLLYRLDGKTPVKEPDAIAWAMWKEGAFEDCRVGLTHVGPYRISTVFLGINQGYRSLPILFESMVFNDATCEAVEQERYATWDEALAGHIELVRRFKELTMQSPTGP